MNRFTDVQVCVFDAYGTLFDVHSPVGRTAAMLGDKAPAVSRTWREKQLQYTWLRSWTPPETGVFVGFVIPYRH